MDIETAKRVFGLSSRCYSQDDLKKKYKILALKLHPDKNGNTLEATQAFQSMNQAYSVLMLQIDKTSVGEMYSDSENYSNIFFNYIKTFFKMKDNDTDFLINILNDIIHNYASISFNAMLESMEPSTLLKLHETLEKYHAVIKMDNEIFEEIIHAINIKIKTHNIIILNPSLKDVIQNNISVVRVEDAVFYVPLWHSELHYRTESTNQRNYLIVKCIPVLPDHVSIDTNNELHVDVTADVKELIKSKDGLMSIKLFENENIVLNIKDLNILSHQTIVLKNNPLALPVISLTDIYDVSTKSLIYVHVRLI